MLSEDVFAPRGVACITYNNECARELEQRLDALGIEPGGRVFIGTVHSFSLTQIILPYAKSARLNLPEDFRVATHQEQRVALELGFERTIGGAGNPFDWELTMGRYRRSILDRQSEQWRTTNPQVAALVEAYEEELRAQHLIDFDDMPLLAVNALRQHQWLQQAILAKYPILVVDEYQDLGRALHGMVMGLCFRTGIRLFAVGDVDQSIYGFTGAHPDLLQRLSERADVETFRLQFNYRCGSRIVEASQYALGQDRDYQAVDDAEEGLIYFHPMAGNYDQHADFLFTTVLRDVFERLPDALPGDIAILYPAAWIGNAVFDAAQRHGFGAIRTDGNAIYPRSSRLMSWLELCAVWCCNGWRIGTPRFSKIVGEGNRIFAEVLVSDEQRLSFQRELLRLLWAWRESTLGLHEWLQTVHENLISSLIDQSRTLVDEGNILTALMHRTAEGHGLHGMTLGQFAGIGEGNDRINLSTLHSAKGREFRVVVLFGMDDGRLPRNNASEREQREARRLFYVGFTRAKSEVHIMFSANRQSPFVEEVQERIDIQAH